MADRLAALAVPPQFFAFRWITLLFTQDLSMPGACVLACSYACVCACVPACVPACWCLRVGACVFPCACTCAKARSLCCLRLEHALFLWPCSAALPDTAAADVVRVWDSLFAADDLLELVLYVCAAMVSHVRAPLLAADFATAVKLLQNYPRDLDVAALLAAADRMVQQVRMLRWSQCGFWTAAAVCSVAVGPLLSSHAYPPAQDAHTQRHRQLLGQ